MASVTVLTAQKVLQLLGDTIVSGEVVGDNLILTTQDGVVINAGNVRGPSATNPTALQVSFSPAAGVAATNVQKAVEEIANDGITLSNNKLDKSALPKILAGRVTHPSTAQTTTRRTYNVFPTGYFSSAPDVIITPNTTAPQNVIYFSVTAITTKGFDIVALRETSSNTVYEWIAM